MPALEDDRYTRALRALGNNLARPRAVVIVSGHWQTRKGLALTSSPRPVIWHDYVGFPEEYYRIRYEAPGDPALAADAADLLRGAGIEAALEPERPLDHGAWVPLSRMYPAADVPVVQLSLPLEDDPWTVYKAGEALAPLRDRDILLAGSGALSHNLRLALPRHKNDPADAWAVELDRWIGERLDRGDTDSLLDYRRTAPHVAKAAPTADHFLPLFFVLGAAQGATVRHLHDEIRHANGIVRIFAMGE